MKVDISPNLPPMSSWTAAAPFGSGSDGGGSSTPRRSMRWITRALPSFREQILPSCATPPGEGLRGARRGGDAVGGEPGAEVLAHSGPLVGDQREHHRVAQ